MSVMHETRCASFIHDNLGGHSPQLEEVDFLPVQFEHAGLRIGQTDEGQVVLFPISLKSLCIFRADDHHLRPPFDEFLIVLAQLRHVPLAERSGKGAVEDQQYVGFAAKIGEANGLSLEIRQSEIRRRGIDCNSRHELTPFENKDRRQRAFPLFRPGLTSRNARASVSATSPKVIQVGTATAGTAACFTAIPISAHRITAA